MKRINNAEHFFNGEVVTQVFSVEDGTTVAYTQMLVSMKLPTNCHATKTLSAADVMAADFDEKDIATTVDGKDFQLTNHKMGLR